MFEWYMQRLYLSMDTKNDMYIDKIGLHTQIIDTVLGPTLGRPYVSPL